MKAIQTKYLGPTDTRGSRIKASSHGHNVILTRDFGLNIEDNHDKAALALRDEMGWKGSLLRGHTEKGNVYTFLSKEDIIG